MYIIQTRPFAGIMMSCTCTTGSDVTSYTLWQLLKALQLYSSVAYVAAEEEKR